MYGNPSAGGRGLVKVSPLIWRSSWWLQVDKRRTITSQNATGIFTNKYNNPTTLAEPNIIVRFAEVVLNAAEANARLGNLDEAVALVNTVRDRALGDPSLSYTVAGLGTADAILDAIFKERRIEFLAEGRRWPDIHRLAGEGKMAGVPAKATSRSITNINFYTTDRAIPTDHAIPYADFRFIWPIPLEEIQTNSTAPIEQNPGY